MRLARVISVNSMPTIGALMGTAGSAGLIQRMNESMGSTTFGIDGDPFSVHRNAFYQNVVQPTIQNVNTFANVVGALMSPDVFRSLTTTDDLRGIPAAMHLPLMYDPELLKLLQQGRIRGFGLDPDEIIGEDKYGRLINNGRCDDILNAEADDDGNVYLDFEWWSDDPEITPAELDALEMSRSFMRMIAKTTDLDPTDYPNLKG